MIYKFFKPALNAIRIKYKSVSGSGQDNRFSLADQSIVIQVQPEMSFPGRL